MANRGVSGTDFVPTLDRANARVLAPWLVPTLAIYDSFHSSIVPTLAIYDSFHSSIVPTLAIYDSFNSSTLPTLAVNDSFHCSIVPMLAICDSFHSSIVPTPTLDKCDSFNLSIVPRREEMIVFVIVLWDRIRLRSLPPHSGSTFLLCARSAQANSSMFINQQKHIMPLPSIAMSL